MVRVETGKERKLNSVGDDNAYSTLLPESQIRLGERHLHGSRVIRLVVRGRTVTRIADVSGCIASLIT